MLKMPKLTKMMRSSQKLPLIEDQDIVTIRFRCLGV